jgi:hypothetical protein
MPEHEWRAAAQAHRHRVMEILQPGLVRSRESPEEFKLDETHPVYNFLISYYGIKSAKGLRNFSLWSPPSPVDNHHDSYSEVRLSNVNHHDFEGESRVLTHVRGITKFAAGEDSGWNLDYDRLSVAKHEINRLEWYMHLLQSTGTSIYICTSRTCSVF